MDGQRKAIESCVVDIMSTLREAKITVEDFRGEDSQNTLFRLINEDGIIGQFRKLDALLDDSSFDPEIPISILDYIDKGMNPDLYIKEMRSSGLQETAQVKSKMLTLMAVSKSLESHITAMWPDLNKSDA